MTIPRRYPRSITAIALFLTIISAAQAKYSGGTGEPNDPYQIATAADLITLGETPEDYDKHFILTADIDLDPNLPGRKVFDRAVIAAHTGPEVYYFIGPAFTGVFDGRGHRIKNLRVAGRSFLGLFGRLDSSASVSNLGLEAIEIRGTNRVGGLVGSNGGSIVACYTSGSVSGGNKVGGLVGRNAYGSIIASYSSGCVSGTDWYVGGLVGCNESSNETRIAASYSSASVSGAPYVGGLVGYGSATSVTSSLWDIQTSGQTTSDGGMGLTTAEMMDPQMLTLNGWANDPNWVLDAGRDYPRLAWEKTPGSVIPEANMDWLEGQGTADSPYRIETAGQLILLGKASILWDSHFVLGADIDLDSALPGRQIFGQAVIPVFTGVFDGGGHVIYHLTIQGTWNLGLFGRLDSGAEVSDLGVVDVNIVGSGERVGTLAGSNDGTIVASYSTGSVSGMGGVGGLVGSNHGNLVACYSTGSVSGTSYVGGLVGSNGGSIIASYSNGAVSGIEEVGGLVGSGYMATSSFWDTQTSGQVRSAGGTGKTTAEMQMANTFLIWGTCGSEGIWTIEEGKDYPRLWWENRPGEAIRMPELPEFLLGSGTENDPFLIYTPEELNTVGLFPCEWDKHFKLMADIDLLAFDGKEGRPTFNIIGENGENAFTGVFDGNSHVISHLTIKGTDYVGLFGILQSGAEVRNLGVEDVNVVGAGDRVGGLAGSNGGTISNSYSSGVVSGTGYIGGLVGFNGSQVTACCSAAGVSGGRDVGGLIGCNVGQVTDCYSIGSVSGDSYVGGLVGTKRVFEEGRIRLPPAIGAATSCFWDIQTSDQATSDGGTGKTTAEMQTASTFLEAGWDFVGEQANGTEDTWWIDEGQDYPRLWWEEIEQ